VCCRGLPRASGEGSTIAHSFLSIRLRIVNLAAALGGLRSALANHGVPAWQAPASTAVLDELQAATSPYRIPPDVLDFWRQVDVTTMRVAPDPLLTTPETALVLWRDSSSSGTPFAPLLDVGHADHDCMSVELDVGDIDGGALFEWVASMDTGFTRRHNSLPEWLAQIATLIDGGCFQRLETGDGIPTLRVPHPHKWSEWDRNRPVPADHPVHGDRLLYTFEVSDWPEHWRRVRRSSVVDT